jgi:hypothetical protein
MSDFKTVSIDELRQWLANAFVTGSQALGHGKSASNEQMLRGPWRAGVESRHRISILAAR